MGSRAENRVLDAPTIFVVAFRLEFDSDVEPNLETTFKKKFSSK